MRIPLYVDTAGNLCGEDCPFKGETENGGTCMLFKEELREVYCCRQIDGLERCDSCKGLKERHKYE